MGLEQEAFKLLVMMESNEEFPYLDNNVNRRDDFALGNLSLCHNGLAQLSLAGQLAP